MPNVEVIQDYYDKLKQKNMSVGDTFEVDQERAQVLINAKVAKTVRKRRKKVDPDKTEKE